jgi:hypothetical protein
MTIDEQMTYLVYQVGRRLGVVPTEMMDRISFVRVRGGRFNRRREFVLSKRAVDQMFTCWRIEVAKEE